MSLNKCIQLHNDDHGRYRTFQLSPKAPYGSLFSPSAPGNYYLCSVSVALPFLECHKMESAGMLLSF